MNERVHIMRESVVKITQLLAGKGIQVTQRGITAYVRPDASGKPILVNLPYMPDNATNELIDAIQGFLDHEVAHILFTDFKFANTVDRNSKGAFWNVLEDTRIEREMAKRFRGSADNLDRTGKFFLDKYTAPRLKEALANGEMDHVKGLLAVPLVRAMAGQPAFQEFMKDNMHHVQEMYDKIKDLEPKIRALSSSQDAATISEEMVGRLRDGVKPPSAGEPPPPPPPAAPSKPKAGKGSKEEKEEKDPEEEDEEKEKEDPEEDGDEEGSESVGGDDEDDGPGGSLNRDDGGDDLINADEMDERESTSADKIDISESSAATWKAIDKETAKDYDEAVSKQITEGAAEAAADSEYLVYTNDKDVVEPLHVGTGYKDAMLTRLQDKVEHMVAPLQKDLERAIAARSLSQYVPGHRSGRMHAANLSRLAVGDPRVFRRKEEVTSKDVAVELVVDMSGSMSGPKIDTAAAAAYALAAVLERIGIKCEVICFTTGEAVADYELLRKEAEKLGRQYSRIESLYMPILKGFDERMNTEVKKRFGWLPNCNSLRNNVDGECVDVAVRRLLARREKGKVMMVLSDGAPHAAGNTRTLGPHLKKVIENATKAGVNMIGIGIMSQDVRKYYPKSLVLNDVADLPGVVMKELRALLIK